MPLLVNPSSIKQPFRRQRMLLRMSMLDISLTLLISGYMLPIREINLGFKFTTASEEPTELRVAFTRMLSDVLVAFILLPDLLSTCCVIIEISITLW